MAILKRAFVQSVGTGSRPDIDITRPLLWSIRESRPDRIVWIVSAGSRQFAERMASALNLEAATYAIVELSSISNVEIIYRECRAALRTLGKQGYACDDIEADYTSGTKAMTAGLALAAVAHHCGRVKYVTGEYLNGIVQSGTEKEERIQPRKIWADERIQTAMDLCRALRFDAAVELIKDLQPEWLGDYEKQLVAGLKLVANGYGAWDRFEYGRAKGELHALLQLQSIGPELAEFQPESSVLNRLIQLKVPSDMTEAEMPARVGPDRLADLFNNAKRRFDEGRFDDALARLYRLTEMFAQWILSQEYGVITSDVEVSKVPGGIREKLEAQRNREGKIQIGLDWDYQVLEAFGHQIGKTFHQDRSIGVLVKKRNHSLLAHGLAPIDRNEVHSLFDKLKNLIHLEIRDFSHRCHDLEFPWRKGLRV